MTSAAWVRSYRLTPMPRLRFVCFAHAGGSASFFRSWAEHLPSDIDLLAIQYPGREDRFNAPRCRSMDALAGTAADALLSFGDAPLALFGHSLGGALAYEVALRLEHAGLAPRHLFVSAHPAPHLQRGGDLHLRSDDALLADIRSQGCTGTELLDNPEMRSVFLPSVRDDYRIIETYRRDEPPALRCPVDILLGDDDTEVSEGEALGWQVATCQALTMRRFSGAHFYLIQERRAVIAHLLCRTGHATAGEIMS